MRFFIPLLLTVLLAPLAVAVPTYYVRPAGDDTQCDGSVDVDYSAGVAPACAFATPQGCADAINGAQTCLIAPGTYYTDDGFTDTAAGLSGAQEIEATCTCTRGSTTIECDSITQPGGYTISAGEYVRCAEDRLAGWTRVESVDYGTDTITLVEGYRGFSSDSQDWVWAAEMTSFVGTGASPDDVVLTSREAQPAGLEWTLESGSSCVYSYSLDDPAAAGTKWARYDDNSDGTYDRYPFSFHSSEAFDEQCTYGSNGCDTDGYWWVDDPTDCVCGDGGSFVGNMEPSPGTAAVDLDAGKAYMHTYNCEDPDTLSLVADDKRDSGSPTLGITAGNSFISNMTIAAGKSFMGGGSGPQDPLVVALSVVEGGSLYFEANHVVDDVTLLSGRLNMRVGTSNELEFNATGVSSSRLYHGINAPVGEARRFSVYDTLIRHAQWDSSAEGSPNVTFQGNGAYDYEIYFGRVHFAKVHTRYADSECGAVQTFDCDTTPPDWVGNQFWRSGHQVFVSSSAWNLEVSGWMIENSIFEHGSESGVALFGNASSSRNLVRNNIFGPAPNPNLRGSTWLEIGSAVSGMSIEAYNNIALCDFDDITEGTMCGQGWLKPYPDGNTGNVTSDYNLFVYTGRGNGFTGSPRVWGPGEDLETVIAQGDEANSIMVCSSGCSGTNGTYFNDGYRAHGYLELSLEDGDKMNYGLDGSGLGANRGVDAGLNSQCPDEDFNGNPRTDGACDIGAFEATSGGGLSGMHVDGVSLTGVTLL